MDKRYITCAELIEKEIFTSFEISGALKVGQFDFWDDRGVPAILVKCINLDERTIEVSIPQGTYPDLVQYVRRCLSGLSYIKYKIITEAEIDYYTHIFSCKADDFGDWFIPLHEFQKYKDYRFSIWQIKQYISENKVINKSLNKKAIPEAQKNDADYVAEIARLKARLAELERQLAQQAKSEQSMPLWGWVQVVYDLKQQGKSNREIKNFLLEKGLSRPQVAILLYPTANVIKDWGQFTDEIKS